MSNVKYGEWVAMDDVILSEVVLLTNEVLEWLGGWVAMDDVILSEGPGGI